MCNRGVGKNSLLKISFANKQHQKKLTEHGSAALVDLHVELELKLLALQGLPKVASTIIS